MARPLALVHRPFDAQLTRYQRSIRNAEKQRYAEDWIDFCLGAGPEPRADDYDLGYMARQAVELSVAAILERSH